MKSVNSTFKESGYPQYDMIHAIPAVNIPERPISNQKPNTFQELVNVYGKSPMIAERIDMEAYVDVPGYPGSREYVIARIHGTSFTSAEGGEG